MIRRLHPIVLATGIALVSVFTTTGEAAFVPFSVGGDSTPASIQTTVENFRNAIGGINNLNVPSTTGGRREINWDGGGAVVGAAGATPFNVFLDNRGARVTTPGTGFLQTPVNDSLLTTSPNGNSTYATTFVPFSPVRIFTPTGSNISDVFFFLPGTNGAVGATVRGFGAVFSDVDLANITQLQFFDQTNTQIFSGFVAPVTVPGGLSFLGALGNAGEQIARVRITTGNTALGPNAIDGVGGVDVVVLDDFIFAEPVPEPASLTLSGLGMVGVLMLGFWRKHFRHRWAS